MAVSGTILVIDDDIPINEFIAEVLRDEGYTVAMAFNGLQGLDLISTQHPDLILLDMYMPGMNGPTVLAHLRANQTWAGIPVIGMSAGAFDHTEMRQQGARLMLQKPFDIDMMLQAVKTYIQAGTAPSSPSGAS